MKLLISLADKSEDYIHGLEAGRLWQMMEQGDSCIENRGFPVRLENKETLQKMCKAYGYIAAFGAEHFDEWVEFLGIKKEQTNN